MCCNIFDLGALNVLLIFQGLFAVVMNARMCEYTHLRQRRVSALPRASALSGTRQQAAHAKVAQLDGVVGA